MVVRAERAVVLDEVEQMRHLLEIGRHVRVVALEMGVVELDLDDVLDLALGRVQLTPPAAAVSLAPFSRGADVVAAAVATATVRQASATALSMPRRRECMRTPPEFDGESGLFHPRPEGGKPGLRHGGRTVTTGQSFPSSRQSQRDSRLTRPAGRVDRRVVRGAR
jgi:hypothetical protein